MFDALPEAFGSYRVLEESGGGRFGPVYRAHDAATGELVAIKVFDQGLTMDRAGDLAQALDRLCRAPLDHPVIVPRLIAGAAGDRAWVAEPWLEGMLPLDYVMRESGPQPLADVLFRITQVAGALDFAAAAGIFHGALHPRDILVSDDRTLVTGIGVLQALGEAGLDVPMTGAYVSPHRAEGEAPAATDDVFALAAIAYELVYGTPVPALSELRASMTRLTGVDHTRFVDLLEAALSAHSGTQPRTALAFAGALQQVVVEGGAVEAAAVQNVAVEGLAVDPAVDPEPETPGFTVSPAADAERHQARSDHRDAASDVDSLMRDTPARPSAADLPLRGSTDLAWEPESDVRAEPDSPREPALTQSAFTGRMFGEPAAAVSSQPAESASGYWFPVAAALAIGIFAGFAGGFVVGQRDSTPLPASVQRLVSRGDRTRADETPTPTAGRDFTEADLSARRAPEATRQESATPPLPSRPATPQDVTEQEVVAPGQRTPSREPGPANPNREQEPGTGNMEPGTRGAALTAEIEVDSRPRGASVFLDGRLVGRTPLVLDTVRPGSHAVRIDLVGHRRWVTSVDVAAGSRHRVAASLER